MSPILTAKKDRPRDADGELLSDQWETPVEDVAKCLNRFYKLVPSSLGTWPNIDAAASKSNTKCPLFITRKMDNLKIDWFDFAFHHQVDPTFWHNCPYSGSVLSGQVQRDYEMAKKGCFVWGYYPVSTSTKWFQKYIYNALPPEYYWFKPGRSKFEAPPGIEDLKRPCGDNLAVLFTPEYCK